jgi:UTP-glucose-1-phosphate uridylyltransferase
MLHSVALVRTDVSKKHIVSIIRVTRIGELGTISSVTGNRSTLRRNTRSVLQLLVADDVVPSSPILVTLMMKAIRSYDKSILTRAIGRNIPKYGILHSHRRENIKSYIELTGWTL